MASVLAGQPVPSLPATGTNPFYLSVLCLPKPFLRTWSSVCQLCLACRRAPRPRCPHVCPPRDLSELLKKDLHLWFPKSLMAISPRTNWGLRSSVPTTDPAFPGERPLLAPNQTSRWSLQRLHFAGSSLPCSATLWPNPLVFKALPALWAAVYGLVPLAACEFLRRKAWPSGYRWRQDLHGTEQAGANCL